MTEHQGCYHIKVMQLFLFAEISRWGEEIGGILEMKKAELLSAPTLAHHTLQSVQTALTRTCGKTWGNRQKETHLQTHTPALSLCSGGSQQESQSVRLFFPPQFLSSRQPCLAGLAICSPCCGTQSCLWLQDFHKVAGTSGGVLQKNEKQEEKWAEVSQAVVPAVIWDR